MIAAVEAGLVWRAPQALLLLAPLALAVCARARARVFVGLARPVDAGEGGPPLPSTWRARLSASPVAIEALALAALIAALARPVEVEVEPPARLGRDVLLCFDRSSSMAAQPARADSSIATYVMLKALMTEFLLTVTPPRGPHIIL